MDERVWPATACQQPVQAGVSFGPSSPQGESGTLGGFVEVQLQDRTWKKFGLTCFHCVRPQSLEAGTPDNHISMITSPLHTLATILFVLLFPPLLVPVCGSVLIYLIATLQWGQEALPARDRDAERILKVSQPTSRDPQSQILEHQIAYWEDAEFKKIEADISAGEFVIHGDRKEYEQQSSYIRELTEEEGHQSAISVSKNIT